MKFIVERNVLREALSVVMGRTKNSNIPILSHILVEADGSEIKLTGHDLDSCSQVAIAAEVSVPGRAVIPADRLHRLVGGLAEGSQISISADAQRASIRCGRSSYQLALLNPDDFPNVLTLENPVKISLTAKQVARLFKTPAPCALLEKSRVYLQGIYLHGIEKRVAACATDGHTLLRALTDVKAPEFKGVIVPIKSCEEFVRVAGDAETALIEITDNLISIEAGPRRFVSKIIDGTFPDYERVIPSATAPVMTVEAKEVEAALARVIAARDPERPAAVRLSWDDKAESFSISLKTQFGDADEQIDCDCRGRESGEIGVLVEYLGKLIDALGGARVRLFIDGQGDPIRMENPDDPDVVAVLMPCRV